MEPENRPSTPAKKEKNMRHASKHQSLQLLKSLEMNDLDQNRRAFE